MTAKSHQHTHITLEQADDLIRQHTVEVSDPAVPKQPKVSVRIITYNQARFIAQALDGALMQQTDFPFEIVVGDDHSTDGTTQIILDYQKRYPDKIRVLLADENLGKYTPGSGRLNFIRALQACRGIYIALLEGDDYWTDAEKLQKQVGLMESQPDVTLCGHRVLMVSDSDSHVEPVTLQPPVLPLIDVLTNNLNWTCSIVMRKEIVEELPEWLLYTPFADWPLQMHAALLGKVAFLNDVMGCYRFHPAGVWSGRSASRRAEDTVEFYKMMRPYIPDNYWRQAAHNVFVGAAKICRADNPLQTASIYLLAFRTNPARPKRLCAWAYYLCVYILNGVRKCFKPAIGCHPREFSK